MKISYEHHIFLKFKNEKIVFNFAKARPKPEEKRRENHNFI